MATEKQVEHLISAINSYNEMCKSLAEYLDEENPEFKTWERLILTGACRGLHGELETLSDADVWSEDTPEDVAEKLREVRRTVLESATSWLEM